MNHADMTLDHEQRLRYLESLERPIIAYGSCWGNEINWSQASAAQNTWYEISDADMSDGKLYGVTHDGSGLLTLLHAGNYFVAYSAAVECSTSGKHVQSGISLSGTEQSDGIDHFETQGANAQFHLGSIGIVSAAANQTIQISIRTTDTGTPTLSVDHLNIFVGRFGSTS